ncbi:MAG: hypothetical protein J6M42_12255 [Clostridia bacterium]|nr:hypothetical protein [Clostridia bacterium]
MRRALRSTRIFALLALLLLGLTVCLLSACDSGSTPADTTAEITPAPTDPVTEPPTEAPTEAPTEEPTEEVTTEPETELKGWEQDTGRFNDGKVDYVKNEDGSVTVTPREGYGLGLDITDKTDIVGICYSVWFDFILGSGTEPVESWHNITEALAGNQSWGPSPAFHYWAKPAQGYYRSSDKTAIRNNMTMIYNAGVDFIILDHTNLHNGYLDNPDLKMRMIDDPMIALFDTILEMRAEGLGTPYVVVWCGDNDGRTYRYLYDSFYNQEKWKDCFVYWDGLPLLLTTHIRPEGFPLKDENLFTVRSMWGLGVDYAGGQWSYLNPSINGAVTYGADGKPEHVGVSTAAQKNYMGIGTAGSMGPGDAVGRKQGKTWYVQWYYAFKMRPKIVTLTWWNEWTAQKLDIGGGKYAFTDNFNAEYSRDIEPMEGGHGDQYYKWLIGYISAYKGHLECPVLVEEGQEESAITLRKVTFKER